MPKPTTVVFDIGGVLLDWNPRYLFRKLFDDEKEMEYFLTHVCSHTWNQMQDAGRSFAEGVAELSARYPHYTDQITAYHQRWKETVGEVLDDTVQVMRELQQRAVPLYAITNFNHETFDLCRGRYDFLDAFGGIIVSGEVRLLKPDPAIYLRLMQDYGLRAADCVFIDDSEINVIGARHVGMHAIQFQSAEQLRGELARLELL